MDSAIPVWLTNATREDEHLFSELTLLKWNCLCEVLTVLLRYMWAGPICDHAYVMKRSKPMSIVIQTALKKSELRSDAENKPYLYQTADIASVCGNLKFIRTILTSKTTLFRYIQHWGILHWAVGYNNAFLDFIWTSIIIRMRVWQWCGMLGLLETF